MCLLTYFPPSVQPDTDALFNGTVTNDDGHGFAIVNGDRIIVRRSLDSVKLIDKFKELRAALPDGPALFHSRFGTAGSISKKNCHPYWIGGEQHSVVGHNGVLSSLFQPRGDDRRSDTKVMAEDFLPFNPFGSLTNPAAQDQLGEFIGGYNKLVFLSVHPTFSDQQAIIINEDRGIWDDGVWYSNSDYRGWRGMHSTPAYTYPYTSTGDYTVFGGRKATTCKECFSLGSVDPEYGYCGFCGWCKDCEQASGSCLCYQRHNQGWYLD